MGCAAAIARLARSCHWLAAGSLSVGCLGATHGADLTDPGPAIAVVTDDPLLERSWHLGDAGAGGGLAPGSLRAFEAWPTSRGAGQLIAIVDTGVELDHPDLRIAAGHDFADDDDDPGPDLSDDDHPHGTAMAGIAAAVGDNGLGTAGVAPDAQVLPVKVVGRKESFTELAQAITYAVNRGASVISSSWGHGNDRCAPLSLPEVFADALDHAESHGRDGLGAVVVFSIGNGDCDVADNEVLADERVVVVGASDWSGQRAAYSNVGAALDLMGPSGRDLAGTDGLWTTDMVGVLGYDNGSDYYGHATGTSAAAAAVAGVFALMLAANPSLTAAEARAIACQSALRDAPDADWDAAARSLSYGCGRVSAATAVAAATAFGG